VTLASPHLLDLRITTRGLPVAAMRSFGLPDIPVVGDSPQGRWSGWVRYQNEKWSSESQIVDAKLDVDGFAEPLELSSGTVSLGPNRLAVRGIVGKLGELAFSGSYEARGNLPARFILAIPEVNAEEWDRVLAPTLARAGPGFLDRTLRRAAPIPAWLGSRRAEGTITIGSATAGDWRARGVKAQVQWDGAAVHLTNVAAQIGAATFAGELDLDLATPATKYHLAGIIHGVPYRGGVLDLTGTADAEGSGTQLLQTVSAEGTVEGRNIAFAPEADFRTFGAGFQMQPIGIAPRWKLSNVETPQGLGAGSTQEDGQLILTLGQLRHSAPLFPQVVPPK
jgi:hypothetical protein